MTPADGRLPMPQSKYHLPVLALLLAGLTHGAVARTGGHDSFDNFVRHSALSCMAEPAIDCIQRNFGFVDENGDGLLSVEEISAARGSLAGWVESHEEQLSPVDLRMIMLGFWTTDLIGLERLHALYDENGDGGLSLPEVTADIVLDDRPLPEVLKSTDGVRWANLRARLGVSARLLDYLDLSRNESNP